MNRTIQRGALFVAPLVIAGTLFGGAATATNRNVIALQVDTICTDINSRQAIYAFQNKNPFDITVNWTNQGTGSTGVFNVPANSFYGDPDPVHNPGLTPGYATDYNPSDPNNTTVFTAEGWTSPSSQNARVGVACDPSQLPVTTAPTGGNGGGNSGGTGATNTTGTTTTSTTSATGGKGSDTAATSQGVANTAATLADTGAEQIVPLAVASLLAVAVLGTTIAVRKNVL